MSATTMAEVLAEHQRDHGPRTLHQHCTCGWFGKMGGHDFLAHQSAELTAAGFGLVADAKAEAWDEGHRAGWNDRDDDAQSGWVPSGYTADTPNPYAAVRGEG